MEITALPNALTRKKGNIPDFSSLRKISNLSDPSTYTKHDKLFYEIQDYIDRGWTWPDTGSGSDAQFTWLRRLENDADQSTVDFFTNIMFEYDRLPADCRKLVDDHSLIRLFILIFDRNGESLYSDGKYHIFHNRFNDRKNVLADGHRLLSKEWFLETGKPSEGFVRVSAHVDGKLKMNFINEDGLLSDTWFDYASDFREGYAAIETDKGYNFIDHGGNFLSDELFHAVISFSEGFAVVCRKRNDILQSNFIDRNGNFLLDTWFDNIHSFENGFAKVVMLRGRSQEPRINYVNRNGDVISGTWFMSGSEFNKEGYATVQLVRYDAQMDDRLMNGRGELVMPDIDRKSERWKDFIG